MNTFFGQGIDPYAVMPSEAKKQGLEAMISFRMNDAHSGGYLRSQFWLDNPNYRLGNSLDYGFTEVRNHVFGLIEEAVQRYDDCDGIELDFQRFPSYFSGGTTEQRVKVMNLLVQEVRNMLDAVGEKRGKHLALSSTFADFERLRGLGQIVQDGCSPFRR